MYEATYFNGLQERQMKSIKEIYRIGRGPSSSHTMGPESAAKMFINEFPSADRYEAVLYGSLAKTGKGHGTDRVLRETFAPRVGSTYQLHGLPKIQAAIYVITKPLDIDQCGMPLITVIYIFRYT